LILATIFKYAYARDVLYHWYVKKKALTLILDNNS